YHSTTVAAYSAQKQDRCCSLTLNISMSEVFPSAPLLPTPPIYDTPPQFPECNRPNDVEQPLVSSVPSKIAQVCKCPNCGPYSICGLSNESLSRVSFLILNLLFGFMGVISLMIMINALWRSEFTPFVFGICGVAISTAIIAALSSVQKQVLEKKTLGLTILIGALVWFAAASALILMGSIGILLGFTMVVFTRRPRPAFDGRYSYTIPRVDYHDDDMAAAILSILISSLLLIGLRMMAKGYCCRQSLLLLLLHQVIVVT
ncbi:hypothetical protein PFISCL1PPCAC_24520, partial [Pristionchus fissidentatus]